MTKGLFYDFSHILSFLYRSGVESPSGRVVSRMGIQMHLAHLLLNKMRY